MTTTQPYEIRAWLGDDWTEEQIEQITDEYLRMERETDDPEERQALLTAIAQRVDGALDRVELIEADTTAQIRARQARLAVRSAAIAEISAGLSESEAARLYGVDRMTIRSWLGKR